MLWYMCVCCYRCCLLTHTSCRVSAATDDVQGMLISALCDSDEFLVLLQDSFGNYVIQSALDSLPLTLGIRLASALIPHIPSLQDTTGGRRIMSKLIKNYPALLFDLGMSSAQAADN